MEIVVGMWVVLVVVGVVYMLNLLDTAPEGYEDDLGFHYGTPPKNHRF